MFKPHSFLWHYLWVAPNVLLLILAILIVRRSLQRKLPAFLVYAVFAGGASLLLYVMDLMPSVPGPLWWKANWLRVTIEVLVKFALIGEIFSSVFAPYASISKLARNAIRGVGGALVLAAVAVAAFAPADGSGGITTSGRVLELGDFMIECGLLAFIFLFAAFFHLQWDRLPFGIALGRGIAASVQLGTWALMTNLPLSHPPRQVLDAVNESAYHLCVLVWLYYVLTTPAWKPPSPPREADRHDDDRDSKGESEAQKTLDAWNRELERLLRR